jgi:hypothetical protein
MVKSNKEFKSELKSHVKLEVRERKLLIFLAALVSSDPEMRKLLVDRISAVHLKLDKTFSAHVADEMCSRSKLFSVHAGLQKKLGIDLCIEVVTLLDRSTGLDLRITKNWKSTQYFMNSCIPGIAKIAARASPGAVKRVAAPLRYRLMLEPAAKLGNLKILQRPFKNIKVRSAEKDAAHVAAFVAKMPDASKFLAENGATPISLEICMASRDPDAVELRLAAGNSPAEMLNVCLMPQARNDPALRRVMLNDPESKKILSIDLARDFALVEGTSTLLELWAMTTPSITLDGRQNLF